MLASNPSRNSRPELIADDGQGVFLPARPIAWPGPRPESGTPAKIYRPGPEDLQRILQNQETPIAGGCHSESRMLSERAPASVTR